MIKLPFKLLEPGIRQRVFWLSILPAMLISSALLFYLTAAKVQEMEASLSDRGAAIVRHLGPAAEYGVISGNPDILLPLLETAAREPDVQGVIVLDANKQVLSKSGSIDGREFIGRELILDAKAERGVVRIDRGQSLIFYAPVTRTEVNPDDFSLISFDANNEVKNGVAKRQIGWVGLVLSKQSLQDNQKTIVMQSIVILVAGLFLSAILGWRMGRRITQPILALSRSMGRIGQGQLTERVSTDGKGEFGVLQRGINHMASSLQEAHENMQERIDQATAQLTYQASHDALTGLVNRREFERQLTHAIAATHLHGRTHALCYMDLDQFKIINDTCGHAAGDELLRQIAVQLKSKLRERDMLARLGGDEFALLLENCDLHDALIVAEECRNLVQRYRFKWDTHLFTIGVSIGLVMIDERSGTLGGILSAADAACYIAKERGRNLIHVYQLKDSDLARHRNEMQWVARIDRALEENRLRLYWQEIRPVAQTDKHVCHIEILVRMLDEEGNIVLPMAFIPAAERYALMPRLDRWIIQKTMEICGQCMMSLGKKDCLFAINLSGVSLKDLVFRSWLIDVLRQHPQMSQHLCFEITETAAIGNISVVNSFITELQSLGCRFALDDFGSGLSSFTYLKNLKVDYLKIDGAFVLNLDTDALDYSMVEAIQRIASQFGIKTVAEFVESQAVLNCLSMIGVDYAQGSYLRKPEPIETLASLLSAHIEKAG